jgi:hypothetical protein
MKVMFEFSLPEENEEYKLHCQAGDLHSAVWDYAEWLRGICKHGDPSQIDASACRQKLYELLTEHNVDL